MSSSLTELLKYSGDHDYVLLGQSQRIEILTTVVLYLFRLVSCAEMMDVINNHLGWTGAQGIEFRNRLKNRGAIQKCLKFYIYDRVINNRVPARPEVFGITEEDALFVKKLLSSRHKNVLFLKRGLETYYHNGFPPRSLSSFEKGLQTAILECQEYIGKFINKKFRFLTQSGQLDKENIHADLQHAAIYSIYRAYPEISSRLHMVNIGKRGIHNRGQNIIKEQTTRSRNRVVRNEDGTFSGILLSLQHAGFEARSTEAVDLSNGRSISVCNHLMVGLDGRTVPYERPRDVDRRRDLERTVLQVSKRLRGPSPQHFVRLMMGEYDRKFSEWLGQSNDEAIDSLSPKVYAEKCRMYLDIPVETARKFVLQLRENLKDFRN